MIGTPSPSLQPSPGFPCTAAILAGGRGRRLGGVDKCAILIGGRSMLDRQIALVRQLTPSLFVVARDTSAHAGSGVPVIADETPGAGPLGGIATALAHSDQPYTLVVACDMPFLTLPFLQRLVERADGVDMALAQTEDGYQPLCAVYARDILPKVRARLQAGRLDVVGLVRELRTAVIGPEELAAFDPAHVLLSNVNTPDDLQRARARADRE